MRNQNLLTEEVLIKVIGRYSLLIFPITVLGMFLICAIKFHLFIYFFLNLPLTIFFFWLLTAPYSDAVCHILTAPPLSYPKKLIFARVWWWNLRSFCSVLVLLNDFNLIIKKKFQCVVHHFLTLCNEWTIYC